MFEDLSGKARARTAELTKLQNDARRFFFSPDSDFPLWCEMADLNAEIVRAKAKDVFEYGMPKWRAPPGKGKNFLRMKPYREAEKMRMRQARQSRDTASTP